MKEKALNGKTPITRRDFLGGGVAGVGGLLIGTPLAWGGSFTQRMIQNSPPGSGPMAEINAWIHIRTDSEIHFILDKAEMGQGVITGLTAVVAEELDVSPFDIKVDFAPPGSEYGNPKMFGAQITGGSTSVASSFDRLRQAAADARALLVAAASEELKVKAAECSVSKNNHSYFISDSKSNKRVSFGDVAEKAAEINKTMARSLNPIKGVPKPRSQYKILGQPQNQPKPLRRYDAWAKITGRATYGIDVGPEQTGSTEMLHCAVIRCPVAGGKLTQFSPRNPTELGVTQLVPLKGGLAVVAPTFWEALSASKKIKVKWNAGALAQQSTEKFSAAFRNTSQKRGVVACVESALTSYEKMEAALNNSNHQIDATFEVPYVPHATMEPMNCTVHFKGASCDIWVPTQAPAAAREIARQITGLDHAHINVNSTFLGGGFGRRIYQDFVAEAVQISFDLHQKFGVNTPVKVIWTREDDMRHDYYRPMMVHRIRGGMGPDGKIAAWLHHAVGQSIFSYITDVFVDSLTIGLASPEKVEAVARIFGECFNLKSIKLPDGKQIGLADPTSIEGLVTGAVLPDLTHLPFARRIPYAIDHFNLEYSNPESFESKIECKIPVGFWRSVGHSHTAFVIESFIDELARSQGRDPLEFRFSLLNESLNSLSLAKRKIEGTEKRLRRVLGVLKAVKTLAGWGQTLPSGHHLGVAQHESFDTFCAVVIEASVDSEGIKVHRAFVAVDCGFALTPDIIKAQAESAVIFGLTAALKQKITVVDGAVQQSNFHDCEILRMYECPKIEVTIVHSDEAPSGIGEPCVPAVAPALRNALYAATGVPFRRLPLDLKNS